MKAFNRQPSKAAIPRTPFDWLQPAIQLRVLLLSLLPLSALMRAIIVTNTPLENPSAPYGMVSFQLAGSLDLSRAIINSWDQHTRVLAALNLDIDYLYMVAYAFTIGLACVLLSRRFVNRSTLLTLAGVGLSWAMLAALLLDAAENYFLIGLLMGEQHTLWPVLARWCALPKFGLVLAALAYLALGGVLALILAVKRNPS